MMKKYFPDLKTKILAGVVLLLVVLAIVGICLMR